MKYTKMLAMVILVLFAASTCWAGPTYSYNGAVEEETRGAVLFNYLVQRLNPESMEMVIDQEPDDEGNIRHLYLKVNGANFGGFRVKALSLETMFSRFSPPSTWGNGKEIELEDAMTGHFAASVTEADVNTALKGQLDDNWKDVVVDFRNGEIFAKGYYLVRGTISLKILVELFTGLEVRAKQIWLKDYRLEVNNAEKTDIVRDAVKDIQPLVDLSDFVFPLDVQKLDITDGGLALSTRVPPTGFDGIKYCYKAE